MNVGFVCSEYPTIEPAHGGIGSMTQTMARALVERGHDAVVFARAQGQADLDDQGVRIVTLARRGTLRDILATRRIVARALRSGDVDVVEAPENEALCLPLTTGTVVRMNGSHHFWVATGVTKARPLTLIEEQIALRSARGLAAVSDFCRETTRRAMRLGSREIELLVNPIDTSLYRPSRPTDETPVAGRIVFAGTLTTKKGVAELCEAMTLVRERHPRAHLVVVGRDSRHSNGKSFSETMLERLPDETRKAIDVRGPVSREQVAQLMASAEICALPSHMETQGIVFVEAMACGRPLVAGDAGAAPEVITGDCGLLCDPTSPSAIAKSIVELLDDEDLGRRLGRLGRERAVEHYSVDVCVERALEFYERFARRRK